MPTSATLILEPKCYSQREVDRLYYVAVRNVGQVPASDVTVTIANGRDSVGFPDFETTKAVLVPDDPPMDITIELENEWTERPIWFRMSWTDDVGPHSVVGRSCTGVPPLEPPRIW